MSVGLALVVTLGAVAFVAAGWMIVNWAELVHDDDEELSHR